VTRPDSSTTSTRRRRLPIVVGCLTGAAVLAGAVALAPSVSAKSSDDAQAESPSTSVSPPPAGGRGALIYSGGSYSVQLAVTNNTGQNMTWYGGDPSNGHWNERPTTTISNQGSDIMTAYTDQVGGFTWDLKWQLDNGDYVCVELNSAELTNDSPRDISGYVATGLDDFGNCGAPDPAYGGDTSNSGGAHSWVDFTFDNSGD
jgi:hypothetical protein